MSPSLKYEHCGVRWEVGDTHADGDVCHACGERVAPLPSETFLVLKKCEVEGAGCCPCFSDGNCIKTKGANL